MDTSVHDRSAFSCGNNELDRFLREQASQAQGKSLSSTYVLICSDLPPQGEARTVVGYVTHVTSQIPLAECPDKFKKLTKHLPIPVMLLARMGVDTGHQKKKLGEFLLKFALKSAWEINQLAGCHAVIVDAKDDSLKGFYSKYGFQELPDRPLRLYLPVGTLAEFFERG